MINALEDTAKEEGRRLTARERALIAGLRRKTYVLFEKMLAESPQAQAPGPSSDENVGR